VSGAASPSAPPASPGHIAFLDLFRAFAITQVVMIHAGNAVLNRGLAQLEGDGPAAYALLHILVHDSTIYFALISGILYGHLFWRREHRGFMRGRLANVGLPYVAVTLALTLLFWIAGWIRGPATPDPLALLSGFARNLALGDAWNTMWYIPVILALYLVSPWLHGLLQRSGRRWLALVLVLLPLLASRTDTVLTPQMFGYFAGCYMVGMWFGQNPEARLDMLARWRWAAMATVLGASVLIGWMFARGIDMWGMVSLRESAFYVQRLAISVLVLLWLRAWARRGVAPRIQRWMDYLAVAAFGIYFLHGPLLRPLARLIGAWVPAGQPWWALGLAILAAWAAAMMLSIALVELIRRLFPSYSRQLIGA
jgi:peptidoglycan/LPS O-acetylase OafA/YrhL